MKIPDFLSGSRILEETYSKYNGEIKVVQDLAWGKHIVVNNLTQSGGIINDIWKETLKKFSINNFQFSNVLVLGVGGGSAAKLVHKYWPEAKITGVDIDERMVFLGKKYLGLEKVRAEIVIGDANTFVKSKLQIPNFKYDLILVDLYNGDKFPEKFEDEKFLKNIKKMLNKEGMAIFNRLYGGDKRPGSMKFGRKLEKYFKKVDYVYPMANVMFVCYTQKA